MLVGFLYFFFVMHYNLNPPLLWMPESLHPLLECLGIANSRIILIATPPHYIDRCLTPPSHKFCTCSWNPRVFYSKYKNIILIMYKHVGMPHIVNILRLKIISTIQHCLSFNCVILSSKKNLKIPKG